MLNALKKNPKFQTRRGPVVLAILDGVGFGKYPDGDGVRLSNTPVLDSLLKECPNTRLKAHGTAVGMPSDADMGNSEVGHNAIGCGRVFSQGAKLVEDAVTSKKLFAGETWKKLIANVKEHNSTLHFIGLFSDGNVHSNISHLKAMIEEAKAEGAPKTITLEWLKEQFHEGWDRIDSNNSAQQGVFYKQFQRRFSNWTEALQEFRKVAEQVTTEPITEYNIDEVFLSAIGIPRTMQGNPENLAKFISDFRYKLLDMLAGKVVVGPDASHFSFEENTVYQPEEYPLVERNWDIIGDLVQRISKSGVKELTAFRKRSLAGEESSGYQLYHFSFEVIGSIANIRKLVADIDNAIPANRVYLVRSVSLYALNDPAEALFSQESTLPQDFIDSLVQQEMRRNAAVKTQTTAVPAVRGRRGRRQVAPVMETPESTTLSSEEMQVRRAQAVKEFEEAEKKKKYFERFGYGDTLVGGSDECRAVIDVDYIMQN